jgi:hypothetical protein
MKEVIFGYASLIGSTTMALWWVTGDATIALVVGRAIKAAVVRWVIEPLTKVNAGGFDE